MVDTEIETTDFNILSQPIDIVKDPYVFEFLGVPENKPMLESDLEQALVAFTLLTGKYAI